MELGLELMTVIRTHFSNAERELFEVDRVCLGVLFIDFEGSDTRCIIDRGILEPSYFLTPFPFKGQELNVDLNVMPRDLFLITFSVELAHPGAPWKPVEAVASRAFKKNFPAELAKIRARLPKGLGSSHADGPDVARARGRPATSAPNGPISG